MRRVSEFIGSVGNLSFKMTSQLWIVFALICNIVFGFVFYNALSDFPGEIEPGEICELAPKITLVFISILFVFETAEVLHQTG